MANPPGPPSGSILQRGQQLIDDNAKPIPGLGVLLLDTQTLIGNNTTVTVPIFSVVGAVQINALYGIVTTALGVNVTTAYWRLNDSGAQSNITLNTGTDISAAPAGSVIAKKGLAAAALALLSASQERVSEPTTLETMYFSPFVAVQKTGAVTTNIEFLYATTDTPTSGVINFYVAYIPLANGSYITAL